MRYLLLALLGGVVCLSAARADNVSRAGFKEWAAAQFAKEKPAMEKEIADLKKLQKEAAKGRVVPGLAEMQVKMVRGTPVVSYASAAEKEAYLAELPGKITTIESRLAKGLPTPPDMDMASARVGDIGKPVFGRSRNAKVSQVIDANNLIAVGDGDVRFWLESQGHGLTDNAAFGMGHAYEVVGTKSYKTVLGAPKTVLHLKTFKLSSLDK